MKIYKEQKNISESLWREFELSTPGLLDQCSNHWATEAVMSIWVVELTSVAI